MRAVLKKIAEIWSDFFINVQLVFFVIIMIIVSGLGGLLVFGFMFLILILEWLSLVKVDSLDLWFEIAFMLGIIIGVRRILSSAHGIMKKLES